MDAIILVFKSMLCFLIFEMLLDDNDSTRSGFFLCLDLNLI